MRWNWQQPDWPHFRWDPAVLAKAENTFLHGTGVLAGAGRHLRTDAREEMLVELMSTEALTTSAIEGEILNRASVQSSIQKQLGLPSNRQRVKPAEGGISKLMVSLYQTAGEPLTEDVLSHWHGMVMAGSKHLQDIGRYRESSEPMQVVSGAAYAPKVHFQAPPSAQIPPEMTRFLFWFNSTAPGQPAELPALTRAGIAHLYFESLHPFEDGNGRIGRAISEKALVQGHAPFTIIALAKTILAHHREYYLALEAANKNNRITDWLRWFAAIALEAQHRTLAHVDFILAKTRLFDALQGKLNDRQHKVLQRMLREGPEGFEGGMTAQKYSTIAGTPPATTTRDLAGLVEAGALTRSGEWKQTRYTLNLPATVIPTITIGKDGLIDMVPKT